MLFSNRSKNFHIYVDCVDFQWTLLVVDMETNFSSSTINMNILLWMFIFSFQLKLTCSALCQMCLLLPCKSTLVSMYVIAPPFCSSVQYFSDSVSLYLNKDVNRNEKTIKIIDSYNCRLFFYWSDKQQKSKHFVEYWKFCCFRAKFCAIRQPTLWCFGCLDRYSLARCNFAFCRWNFVCQLLTAKVGLVFILSHSQRCVPFFVLSFLSVNNKTSR